MRIPRDVSAQDLIKVLSVFGYRVTRQKGSHIRLTRLSEQGDQHITIPNHNPLKLETLASVIGVAAFQLNISREELLNKL